MENKVEYGNLIYDITMTTSISLIEVFCRSYSMASMIRLHQTKFTTFEVTNRDMRPRKNIRTLLHSTLYHQHQYFHHLYLQWRNYYQHLRIFLGQSDCRDQMIKSFAAV